MLIWKAFAAAAVTKIEDVLKAVSLRHLTTIGLAATERLRTTP